MSAVVRLMIFLCSYCIIIITMHYYQSWLLKQRYSSIQRPWAVSLFIYTVIDWIVLHFYNSGTILHSFDLYITL